MSGVFYISGLNPFRWTLETFTPDPNLNSLPADYEIDLQSYACPIQKTDTNFPALVLLSDFPSMTLEFRKCNGELISTPALAATSSALVNQTFLQYLATVNFGTFPTGRCYGRVSYDANMPAVLNGKLTEDLSPFVDGGLRVKVAGVEKYVINSVGNNTIQANAGLAYSFEAFSAVVSTALNPRIRLTITKTINGIASVIYDHSEVQTGANSFIYSGVAQPGATYSAAVVTEDTGVAVAPINIADNAAVVPNIQSWISCPIDVQQNHPLTQLFKYQNSENTESVLFHPSDLILQKRIEGTMGNYQGKSTRETYEDQPYNPVLLNGFNSDIYTNRLGGYDFQFPDWEIKKLNLIWAKCDQVQIDYEFYVAQGDFKNERPTYTANQNGYNYELDLQIVKGFEFGQLTAGTTPTGDLIVVRKTWPATTPFPLFSTSFAINGVFTQYSTLDYLETVNPALSTFIIKLGTTLGGSDILETEVGTPNADASIELIEKHGLPSGFNAPTTIYVTLPSGVSIRAIIVYDQLDSLAVTSTGTTSKGVPQGTIGWYKELVAGYFTRDWDIATGLGQVGSLYEGFQIYDEAAGKVLTAWDRSTIDPAKGRGAPGVTGALRVGNANNVISSATLSDSLPTTGVEMFVNIANNTNGDKPTPTSQVAITGANGQLGYELHKAVGTPNIGLTGALGKGLNLNVANDGLIMLCYIKL